MKEYKKQFKNKKITIMGLGLLGRGVGYTKFLAECGAILTVTDLKTRSQLAPSIKALNKYTNITFVLGEHRLKDFQNADMVIKAAGVPLDSPYIAEAKKHTIPVEMDVSLFTTCAPGVVIVGVTGTRGKSMTTMLIYEILKANEKFLKRKARPTGGSYGRVYIGGNIRGVATLPLLQKVTDGDVLVCELDSWQLQGFGEAKISPHISVFTTFMPDHMNYYKDDMKKYLADKTNIFKYQKHDDVLIIRSSVQSLIPKTLKSTLIVANKQHVEKWKFIVPGEHQRENLACAVEVAKQFGIPESKIKTAVKNFKGIEGRLQYLKTIRGVKIYNDNNATTPEATIAGFEALGRKKPARQGHSGGNIVIIAGGNDKNIELANLVHSINDHCKYVVLIPGTGTDKLMKNYKLAVGHEVVKNLKEAVRVALHHASRGSIILFSPAFSSFSQYNNEYERNDEFMKIIKKAR